jgi:hypothetical protein
MNHRPSLAATLLAAFLAPAAMDMSAQEPTGISRLGPDFRLYPSGTSQSEPFITVHPGNPAVLFASANTISLSNGFISEGVYVSTDGGATWSGTDTCSGAPIQFHKGEPAIAIDREGRFIMVRFGFSAGLYAHYSLNQGQTWSGQRTITTGDQDRASLKSDPHPASAFYGRTYAVWVRFSPPYPAQFAYTDDGGATWSAPAQINSPVQRGQGGEIAIGRDGSVYVTWAAVQSVSPFTEDFAGFARSTNGGATWFVRENAFDINGINGQMPQKANIRVNGLPRIGVDRTAGLRSGWIYIVTGERGLAPAGSDADVVFHRSTDGGSTWSAGVRVNQDALNNGKLQYFPALHVDDGGGINVLYYDDRDTRSDSATVYLSRSTDGGTTWRDYRVSDHTFRPLPIGGLGAGYQGDNIGLTSVGDTLWPVWMDNFTGIYQIWTSPLRISSLGTSVRDERVPDRVSLGQNYPNPFNPTTRIPFSLSAPAAVRLEVYDVTGRLMGVLTEEHREAGFHEVSFDADRYGLGSGVYVYRLRAGSRIETRTMVLIR